MNLPDRPVSARIVLLILASLVAGCAGSAGGSPGDTDPPTSPTSPTSPSPASPFPANPATTSPAPSPSDDPAIPTACLSLGPQDCERARAAAASTLAFGDPPVRYVQVGPFGCAAGDRCPPTLAARPEGDVVLEFPGGQGINVHLTFAADGTFEATREAALGVAVEPASADGAASGPIAFSLGHCGIFSGIDVDGSWWDPVAGVSMDTGDAVNATAGTLTFIDEGRATFTTPTGFSLQLVRREGPKLLPMCM